MIVRPTRTERSPAAPAGVPVTAAAATGSAGPTTAASVELRIERLVVDRSLFGRGGARPQRRFEAALSAALERRLAAPPDRWPRATATTRRTARLPALPSRGPEALAEALAEAVATTLLTSSAADQRGARAPLEDPS